MTTELGRLVVYLPECEKTNLIPLPTLDRLNADVFRLITDHLRLPLEGGSLGPLATSSRQLRSICFPRRDADHRSRYVNTFGTPTAQLSPLQ